MNNQLSIEEKIDLLEIAMETVDDYSDKTYSLLSSAQKILINVLVEEESCIHPENAIETLRTIIAALEKKIKKKENYQAVIRQVNF